MPVEVHVAVAPRLARRATRSPRRRRPAPGRVLVDVRRPRTRRSRGCRFGRRDSRRARADVARPPRPQLVLAVRDVVVDDGRGPAASVVGEVDVRGEADAVAHRDPDVAVEAHPVGERPRDGRAPAAPDRALPTRPRGALFTGLPAGPVRFVTAAVTDWTPIDLLAQRPQDLELDAVLGPAGRPLHRDQVIETREPDGHAGSLASNALRAQASYSSPGSGVRKQVELAELRHRG